MHRWWEAKSFTKVDRSPSTKTLCKFLRWLTSFIIGDSIFTNDQLFFQRCLVWLHSEFSLAIGRPAWKPSEAPLKRRSILALPELLLATWAPERVQKNQRVRLWVNSCSILNRGAFRDLGGSISRSVRSTETLYTCSRPWHRPKPLQTQPWQTQRSFEATKEFLLLSRWTNATIDRYLDVSCQCDPCSYICITKPNNREFQVRNRESEGLRWSNWGDLNRLKG